MNYEILQYPQHHTVASLSAFAPAGGTAEHHLIVNVADPLPDFAGQLRGVLATLGEVRSRLRGARPAFMRWFLSDAANQAPLLPRERECAVSVVGQPPLRGGKLALWVYFRTDAELSPVGGSGVWVARHGAYSHYWTGGACVPELHSEIATMALLEELSLQLGAAGATLADNCVRTWFFVRDVDVNYAGVVAGRNKAFALAGLTADTHYIASTGIGGRRDDPSVSVAMDAYSVTGLAPGQMTYLYAPGHLNRTSDYGVAFERGTRVDYGDRRHLYISGTASIDNRGRIVHPGDIRRQTLRMLENVEALLDEGGCSFGDVAHMIVYLRDPSDRHTVAAMLAGRFPAMPAVMVLAPVCRPGWLIEMECMAVGAAANPAYAPF